MMTFVWFCSHIVVRFEDHIHLDHFTVDNRRGQSNCDSGCEVVRCIIISDKVVQECPSSDITGVFHFCLVSESSSLNGQFISFAPVFEGCKKH
jgi:hypothetical protein